MREKRNIKGKKYDKVLWGGSPTPHYRYAYLLIIFFAHAECVCQNH